MTNNDLQKPTTTNNNNQKQQQTTRTHLVVLVANPRKSFYFIFSNYFIFKLCYTFIF
jgi:hypothetical protein